MKAELERYNLAYSMTRLSETARTFRKLGEAYEDIQGENGTSPAIAEQLYVMANVLDECCGTSTKIIYLSKGHENDIIHGLVSKGVKVEWIHVFERGLNGKEIIIKAKTVKRACVTTKDIAAEISKHFETDFFSSEHNRSIISDEFYEYTFIQVPRFQVLFGMTKSNMDNMEVSGDNFSMAQLECGRVVATLVDGMGAGKRAYCESETVIELVEQCLEAGFDERLTIGLINSAFSNREFLSNPVVVDMCVIDRYLGVLNCIKLGAASTFIKRDGWVEIIKSTTLPIGVFEQVDFDNAVKKLYDGDYIIMVSDGVLENLPFLDKEQKMVEIISDIQVKVPELIAQEILQQSLKYNEMVAKDDMTVIVAGVFDTYRKVY
jgi:stage II sporulation protein E